ncbi:MAG: hypothetical protein RLZZ142_325, partial [Verrucomicrobiota bacterium]
SQTLGGLFLLGTAAISIRYFARRRLQARLVELESRRALDEERARIARDMHDVVGARLTQLGVLHEIFSRKHALPPDATESLARLSSTAREAIAALDEVVWAVNPRNDTLANLADYLCFCAGDYLQPLGIPCRLDVPADWPEIQVRAQTRHEVLLAFKEALQNIAKHSQATEVRLTLRNLNQSLLIQLDDNGMGIPHEQSGMGKDGLLNMRQRIQSVGGSCSVEPLSKEGGTRVQMIVSW